MRNTKLKYLLLLSSALGAGLAASSVALTVSAEAGCDTYAPSSNVTVTCSGLVTSEIDAHGSTNVTINLADGTTMLVPEIFDSAIYLGNDSNLNLYGSALVVADNYGALILGSGSAITLNGSSSIVSGPDAFPAISALGDAIITLNDSSRVSSSGLTIRLEGSGSQLVVSSGSQITGGSGAIWLTGSNIVVNHGTLISNGTAIRGDDLMSESDDIRNYGAIVTTGASGISLLSGDDILTLGTGSSISGSIDGGNGTDELALVGSGLEDSNISNFELLTMDGIDWTLAGQTSFTGIVVNSGTLTLTQGLNFASPGSLENNSTLIADITGSSGTDTIANYGAIVGSISLSNGEDALTLGTGSSIIGTALQAGVELNAAGGWSIVPSVSLAYLHQGVKGYEEQIGSASAVIDSHDAGLLRLRGNLELRHFGRREGIVYTPNLKLGVVDDIGSGGVATGSFSGGTDFELSLSDAGGLRMLAGLGLEALFENGSTARIAYEGEASSTSVAHALALEVKLYW